MKQMWCEYCKKTTNHKYIGKNKFPKYTVEMYDCKVCGSTHSEKVGDSSDNGNINDNGNNGGYQEWTSGYN